MVISAIAKRYKVSDSTVRRRMRGKPYTIKTVTQALPGGVKRRQPVIDYKEPDVAKAFTAKKAKKK